MQPVITLQLNGASMTQTEIIRSMIVKMFEAGVFSIKRGKVVLSFDHQGALGSIEITELRYRSGDLVEMKKSVKLEAT